MAHSSREYMKEYMKDYRAKEREEAEAKLIKSKLDLIEAFVPWEMVYSGQHDEYLVKAKETKVPFEIKEILGSVTSTEKQKVTDSSTGKYSGIKITTTRKIPITEKTPLLVGTETLVEKIPAGWKPHIDVMQTRLRNHHILASDIYLKRQIEWYLPKEYNDLVAERNHHRMYYLANFRSTLKEPEVTELRQLLREHREAKKELEDYAILGLRAGYKVREIVDKAKCIGLSWFTHGFMPSESAPIIVENQLEDLEMQQRANKAAGIEIFPSLHEDDKRIFEAYDKVLREKYGGR